MDFEGSYEVILRHKYFWSTCFWQWNSAPFKIFLKFFLNVRNIAISLLMIHLNIVKHYANLNSSSISKPYLRAVEYVISFFISITYLCLF